MFKYFHSISITQILILETSWFVGTHFLLSWIWKGPCVSFWPDGFLQDFLHTCASPGLASGIIEEICSQFKAYMVHADDTEDVLEPSLRHFIQP